MCFHTAMQIKTSRIPKILQVGTETFSKDRFGIPDMLAKVNSTWYQRMKDILACPWGWMWLGKPGRGLKARSGAGGGQLGTVRVISMFRVAGDPARTLIDSSRCCLATAPWEVSNPIAGP